MQKKNIFSYIFLFIFSIMLFYITWIKWLFSLFISLFIYSLITYLFYFLWKNLFRKKYLNYPEYINLFLYKVNCLLVLLLLIIWWFGYYQNELYPAPMPTITISNWKKEIIFQAMSHIWTQSFYDEVRNNIIEAKKKWFVYFFEWVKPWKPESADKFNNALWVEFNKDLYKNFSKIYWVVYQDNRYFLWLWEKNCNLDYCDFNVDLNMDEIISYYDDKIEQEPQRVNKSKKLPIDLNNEIISSLSKLNDKELKILVFINKSILNFIIKSDKIQDLITNNFSNKTLFDVILNKRNEVVAEKIISSKYNKIFTTYWLLHFDWIFQLLKRNDPNWKIIKKEVLYPIK